MVICGAKPVVMGKVKLVELMVPPEMGFATEIFTSLAAAMSPAVMSALNWVAETNVVGRGVPFHKTLELET